MQSTCFKSMLKHGCNSETVFNPSFFLKGLQNSVSVDYTSTNYWEYLRIHICVFHNGSEIKRTFGSSRPDMGANQWLVLNQPNRINVLGLFKEIVFDEKILFSSLHQLWLPLSLPHTHTHTHKHASTTLLKSNKPEIFVVAWHYQVFNKAFKFIK